MMPTSLITVVAPSTGNVAEFILRFKGRSALINSALILWCNNQMIFYHPDLTLIKLFVLAEIWEDFSYSNWKQQRLCYNCRLVVYYNYCMQVSYDWQCATYYPGVPTYREHALLTPKQPKSYYVTTLFLILHAVLHSLDIISLRQPVNRFIMTSINYLPRKLPQRKLLINNHQIFLWNELIVSFGVR